MVSISRYGGYIRHVLLAIREVYNVTEDAMVRSCFRQCISYVLVANFWLQLFVCASFLR